MASNAYADLAQEYYDPFHKTCRNFDAATKSALARKTFALPDAGLILEVGCGRGRCQEFLGVDKNRVVQLDSSREMLDLTDRESALVRILANAACVPLFDSQFSAVVGFLVDSFIGLCFFAEAYRLLLPGGMLLVTTPASEWGQALRGQQEPEVSSARFVTKTGQAVFVPSTLIASARILEMLSYCGFQSISIDTAPLPVGIEPISADVERAACIYGVAVHELPLVYLINATKPG